MNDPRWEQVQDLFEEALRQPPERRAAYLDATCDTDPELRRELESLLRAYQIAGPLDALAEALHGGGEAVAEGPAEGERVGPYRLVRTLGEGGMGAVYLAAREGAGFEQEVALKLVREGQLSKDRERRFLAERQILARLRHDGIARLLDGGVDAAGRPYFAMEYVEGEPITDYCDGRRLPVEDRLRLFADVCAAVHYAHQHLVVHRDLKPSNVLVTDEGGTPRVKLLDFGIAKLLAEEGASAVRTQAGGAVMTPAYASPEQVRGEPITTASDVYSLGVVLYELLAGRRPYEVEGLPPADLDRVVCEGVPPRPSAVAAPEGRRLAGDLDVIVMKALAKDPSRRYASAEALADDVRRHRAGLPVEARPDTLRYRASTFVRRHRLAVAAAALVGVSLVGGVIGTAWQARRATAALALARQEAATNAQVTDFLVGLFEAPDPAEALGDTLTAYDLLRRGTERVDVDLATRPLVRAAMLVALGRTYHAMGQDSLARPLVETAHGLYRRHLGPSPELARALRLLALVELWHGNHARADSLVADLLRMQRALPGVTPADLAETALQQANLWHETGRHEEAEAAYREVVALYGGERRPHSGRATALQYLALLLQERGRFAEAEPLFAEALAAQRALLGRRHPDLALLLNDYGMMRHQSGDAEGAEPLLREALAMQRRLFGHDHPQLIFPLTNLASVVDDHDLEEADRLTAEALRIARARFEPDHPVVANALGLRAQTLLKTGDVAGARGLAEAAVRSARRAYPEGHPRIGWALVGLGKVLHEAGRPAEAEPPLREGRATLLAAFGPAHPLTQQAGESLAAVLRARGRTAEADALGR